MIFSTSEYQFSHGRSPRGRGSWAFEFPGTDLPTFWTPGGTTYTEAKALVHKHAAAVKASQGTHIWQARVLS